MDLKSYKNGDESWSLMIWVTLKNLNRLKCNLVIQAQMPAMIYYTNHMVSLLVKLTAIFPRSLSSLLYGSKFFVLLTLFFFSLSGTCMRCGVCYSFTAGFVLLIAPVDHLLLTGDVSVSPTKRKEQLMDLWPTYQAKLAWKCMMRRGHCQECFLLIFCPSLIMAQKFPQFTHRWTWKV